MNGQTPSKVFVFPGQGSQVKGMGKDLFDEFKQLTECAGNTLGYCIKDLCLNQPFKQLSQTLYTQPALFVVNSLAFYREQKRQAPKWLAGHSLGEYNALLAAGCFNFENGLKLVMKRATLMSQAKQGSMAAVVGISLACIESILSQNPSLDITIANINSPRQVVLSGDAKHIEEAKLLFDKAGAKAFVKLNVSGAFHSHYMQSEKQAFADYLAGFDLKVPTIPVISNVSAEPYSKECIKHLLVEQLTSPVRWVESIQYIMAQDNVEFIEIGPGKVLTKLINEIKQQEIPIVTSTKIHVNKTVNDSVDQQFHKKVKNITTIRKMVEEFEPDKLSLKALTMKTGQEYESMTYGEMQWSIKSIANAMLNLGIEKGDKIGLLSENRPEWPLVYMACASMGAIVVPLDVFFNAEELNNAIAVSGVKTVFTSQLFMDYFTKVAKIKQSLSKVICFDEHFSLLDENIAYTETDNLTDTLKQIEQKELSKSTPFSQRCRIYFPSLKKIGEDHFRRGNDRYSSITVMPNDPLVYIFMTGERFAILSHGSITANIYGSHMVLHEGGKYIRPGEVSMATLPFYHAFPSMGGFLLPFGAYIEVVILAKFTSKHFVQEASKLKVNYTTTVPYMLEKIYKYMKRTEEKIESLRFFFVGGAPSHKKYLAGMEGLGCKVVQGYGLTEYSPIATLNPPSKNKLGSIGKAIGNTEVKIDQQNEKSYGELLVKGPSLMTGYYNLRDQTARVIKGGWLHTGDLARMDEEGYVFITGRRKNVIVTKSGKNIYPCEIAQLLEKDKYIQTAKVIPKLDEKEGESPLAVIRPNYQAIHALEEECERSFDENEVHQIIKKKVKKMMEDVASYKVPKSLQILSEDVDLAEQNDFVFDDYYLGKSSTDKDSVKVRTLDNGSSKQKKDAYDGELAKLRAYFIAEIAAFTKTNMSLQDSERSYDQLGLDSISLIKLKFNFEQKLEERIPIAILGESKTISQLAENICQAKSCLVLKQKILSIDTTTQSKEYREFNVSNLIKEFLYNGNDLSDVIGAQLDEIYEALMNGMSSVYKGSMRYGY